MDEAGVVIIVEEFDELESTYAAAMIRLNAWPLDAPGDSSFVDRRLAEVMRAARLTRDPIGVMMGASMEIRWALECGFGRLPLDLKELEKVTKALTKRLATRRCDEGLSEIKRLVATASTEDAKELQGKADQLLARRRDILSALEAADLAN